MGKHRRVHTRGAHASRGPARRSRRHFSFATVAAVIVAALSAGGYLVDHLTATDNLRAAALNAHTAEVELRAADANLKAAEIDHPQTTGAHVRPMPNSRGSGLARPADHAKLFVRRCAR